MKVLLNQFEDVLSLCEYLSHHYQNYSQKELFSLLESVVGSIDYNLQDSETSEDAKFFYNLVQDNYEED